jgi:diguanylate cyclase (GGDEF)-like protein
METYRRQARPFAILMIDIDHFKPINDALGHTSGDLVIRAVARAVTGALRPSDRGGRFGGEEFIVLLHDVGASESVEVGERIRACVASLAVPVGAKGELYVTVSLGIAVCDPRDAGIDDVIERADTALYVAKREGRNRSHVAGMQARRIA